MKEYAKEEEIYVVMYLKCTSQVELYFKSKTYKRISEFFVATLQKDNRIKKKYGKEEEVA
ncbi:hypothetical protein [Duncaniella muris]|uniref:hypothetical protein n=1 Tax=Duncaniella muris TaxID=2094150 RepID=UPI003F67E6B9